MVWLGFNKQESERSQLPLGLLASIEASEWPNLAVKSGPNRPIALKSNLLSSKSKMKLKTGQFTVNLHTKDDKIERLISRFIAD